MKPFEKIPYDRNTLTELTAEQIEAAKAKYGDIYLIEVGGRKIYLHKPGRAVIDMAQLAAAKAPSKFEETIMTSCWLAGDKEVITDPELFYGAASQLNGLMEVAYAEIKKL